MSKPLDSEDGEPQGTEEAAAPRKGSFAAELQELAKPDRDEYGRWKKGVSGNPGGMRKEFLEARRAFAFWLPEAIRRNAALLCSDDPMAVSFAAARVFDRALGKASSPMELPTDDVVPDLGDTSPRALLDRAMRLKARTLALAEKQLEDGQALSDEQRRAINEDIASLSSVLKAEAEAAKSGDAGTLTDAQLKEKVLAALSVDDLSEEWARRKAAGEKSELEK